MGVNLAQLLQKRYLVIIRASCGRLFLAILTPVD